MPSIIEVDTIKNKTGTQNTVLSTDGSGNNTLNAGVIKSNTGSNTGLTIASDGQVTISQNNPTITLGANTTFPAGHVIQTQYYSVGFTFSSHSTNFVKTTGSPDFEKTITPLKADSNIMIMISSQAYSGAGNAFYDIYKNASDFTETTNLSGKSKGISISSVETNWNGLHYTFIDTCSENSVSTKTYAPTVRTSSSSVYFGYSTDFLSTIVLMEIAT